MNENVLCNIAANPKDSEAFDSIDWSIDWLMPLSVTELGSASCQVRRLNTLKAVEAQFFRAAESGSLSINSACNPTIRFDSSQNMRFSGRVNAMDQDV